MLQLTGDLRLFDQPPHRLLRGGGLVRPDLFERDLASQVVVASQPDLAESPWPTSLIQVYRDFGLSSSDWINVSTSTGPPDGQELSDCWMSESATFLMASQTSPRTTEFKVTRGSC